MTLETALQENTATMKELIAHLKENTLGRAEALSAAKAATEKAPAAAKAAPKAETKAETAAPKAETKTADAPAADSPDAGRAAVKSLAAAYITAEGTSEDEQKARKTKVTDLFGKVGAKSLGEVDPAKFPALTKALNTLIEKNENLVVVAPPAGAEDDDLLG